MLSEIYWIPQAGEPALAIMARPRSDNWLEDEIAHWKDEGVGLVVSLLDYEEESELGLQKEKALCERRGLKFLSFPIPDRGVPNKDASRKLVHSIEHAGLPTAVHCRAGIGRSSLVAVLIMMARGISANEALQAIAEARRLPVPDTEIQRQWLLDYEW